MSNLESDLVSKSTIWLQKNRSITNYLLEIFCCQVDASFLKVQFIE
jgi:hypothetical protein